MSVRLLVAACLAGGLPAADVVAWWTCDAPAGPVASLEPSSGPAATVQDAARVSAVADVPAPFVYDGLARRSRANRGALRVQTGAAADVITAQVDPAVWQGSFTIECFLKPEGEPAQAQSAVAVRTGDGIAFRLGTHWLTRWKQTYYGPEAFAADGAAVGGGVGHYVTIARLRKDAIAWRHLALSWDADARRLTGTLDHWCTQSWTLPAAPKAATAFAIAGGGADAFAGLIDEVRVTRGVLRPAQFLRARTEALEGVDFASRPGLLPADSGAFDLREHFGAVGDGKADDTAAIQKAFTDVGSKPPAFYATVWAPAGTYLVRDTCRLDRFTILQGDGRDRTVFRLADGAPGFNDPKQPRPVIRASSTNGAPGSNKQVNGSSIGIYGFDFAIDTGSGNPGACAIEYHTNNHGSLMRVDLRSGDGAGVCGLDLSHKTVGPGLVKDVSVRGFDLGMRIGYQEYSMTLEDVRFADQRVAAIRNQANILALRRIESRNRVPALLSLGGASMVSLLDSAFTGGGADADAISAEGALYVRNLTVAGYRNSLVKKVATRKTYKDKETQVDGAVLQGDIVEFVGDEPVAPRGGAAKPLGLPIAETPYLPWGDVTKDWVAVEDFADRKQGEDWGPAIQAAVDSGKPTVFFRGRGYTVDTPVRITRPVRLFGLRTDLNRSAKEDTSPNLIVACADPKAVVSIERIDVRSVRHEGACTLLLLHSTPGTYANARGAGRLFAEDVEGNDWHFDRQQVWVRQWNPEEHGAGPCIESDGATIWALGFKTEYESSKLWQQGGAKTDIYGAFIYPVVKGIPPDRPVFRTVDSSLSVIFGTSVYTAGHPLFVLDIQGGDERLFTHDQAKPMGSRQRVDLYVSRMP